VLSAVFVPCAFISGITGQFFRQFALTIAASTIISTFNSLTLSPALAAILLKPRGHIEREVLPRLFYVVLGAWLAYRGLTPRIIAALGGGSPLGAAEAWLAPLLAGLAGAGAGWLAALPANAGLAFGFRLFERSFRLASRVYIRVVGLLLRMSVVVLVVYGGLLALTWWQFTTTPKGFIPSQDMGYLMVNVQLPDSAAAARTQDVTARVQRICIDTPGVKHTVAVAGQSFMLSAYASYFGSMFVILDEFSKRREPRLAAEVIAAKIRKRCEDEVPDALITVLPPPPIRGVGRTGGFKLMVEDRADLGPAALQRGADDLAEKGRQLRRPSPAIAQSPAGQTPGGKTGGPAAARNVAAALLMIPPNVFRANAPQLYVDMNRVQCILRGVALADAFDTLRIYLGSLYVNDFNLFGRTWRVIVQADEKFRGQADSAGRLRVRSRSGAMVPLGSLADIRPINGPLILTRYNMYPASAIQGTPGRGVSSRQAIDLMQDLADTELPEGMRGEWTELAFLEIQAGNTAMMVFGLAVLVVFLVLAAQYESWSLPLAVILVVPLCLLGAVVGVWAVPLTLQWLASTAAQATAWLRHAPAAMAVAGGAGGPPGGGPTMDINIFTQIGFVVLVGLASKNAILIVEFAKHRRDEGASRREAALAACTLRLRPIVMTSCAFILGVFPLLIARGAGSEMRRTLGTAVFSGMLGVTLFGIYLTPVFFSVIDWLSKARLLARPRVRIVGGALLLLAAGGTLFTLGGWRMLVAVLGLTLGIALIAWVSQQAVLNVRRAALRGVRRKSRPSARPPGDVPPD